ncbi:MAG: SusC/RagA family TonB-linked outer membrane protein, partial [Bacteroidota bacterium]|nr:SusC/RagA family TonB-linked outer membrane protein [Bacteroidota bacterium]
MKYPSVNYRDMMLKNSMAYNRANMSSSGGNDIVQYYTYLGYSGEGDIYKIGAPADYNRLNTRANIDIKINDIIKVQFDFFGGLSFRRSPNYGWDIDFLSEDGNVNTVLDIVEFGSVINEITATPPIAFPVYANNDPALDKPWYGVSSNFKSNPIGNLVNNGYYTESGRTGAFNVALDFNLNKFVKGLNAKSYIGFNAFNLLRIGKAEDYSAYIVTPAANPDGTNYTLSKITEHSSYDMANQEKLHDFYFQRFVVYETLDYERKFGKHDVHLAGTYYLSKILRNGIEEPERQQNGILTGIYSYNDKYNLQGVLNYSGSSSYSADARNFLSPTVGASWVISEEGFMKGAKFINYLKLRAEGGILGYESFAAPFAYRDRYNYNTSGTAFGPFTTNQWFGATTDNQVYRTSPNRTGNPLLDWEKRREFTVGLDALMLGEKLSLEVNYYDNTRDGMVSQLTNTIPYVVGVSGARPRANFNKIRYFGLETGLTFSKRTGDFKYSIGGNATIQNSEILKYDEANYRYPHQSRIGTPLDSYWGQIYLGKFATDADALVVPQLYDDVLHAGDLQYKDMNNDGVVDDNDASKIGHTTPRLFYSLNIKFSYK